METFPVLWMIQSSSIGIISKGTICENSYFIFTRIPATVLCQIAKTITNLEHELILALNVRDKYQNIIRRYFKKGTLKFNENDKNKKIVENILNANDLIADEFQNSKRHLIYS